MAHPEQRNYISNLKNRYSNYFSNKKVLEVGSLDINGTVRDFFSECDYTGIDVGSGPGVDIICPGQEYDAPDNIFDVTCSLECFEHNPFWKETFLNMVRMTRSGGLVFFTCATEGRPEHGTTRTTPNDSPLTIGIGWDYYKNLKEVDFTSTIDLNNLFESYEFQVNTASCDLYFSGVKK